MKFPHFLMLGRALALVGGYFLWGLCHSVQAADRPNFLFILTDDQRFDALGAAGCREISTPAMDRLAAEGLSFTQATIMGGNNPAVCLPSRSMIMTGMSLFRCQGVIPKNAVTVPQLLRQHGYATFATGKWHNDDASLLRSFEFGTAIFHGGMGDHFRTTVSDLRGGQLTNQHEATNFDAEVFASATMDFLKNRPKSKPFFAYLAFKTPHDPRVVPLQFHQMYDAAKLSLPPNFLPQHPFDNGELRIRDELLAGFPRRPVEVRQHLAAYYAATTATDDQIGRVLQTLDELQLTQNTIVVLAGDNGLAVGQHGLMGKQNLYEHSIRVPLILRGPGILKGRRSAALCQLFDVYPTLAAQAGLKPPATVDGKDLGHILRGEKSEVRDATLHAYKEIQRAVRTQDAKLIEYLIKGQPTTQLFDLRRDPWETNNLAQDPAHAGLLLQMRERYRQLARDYTAPPLGQSVTASSAKDGKPKGKRWKNAEAGE
jgi:arylsulfatase A-like enzyme